MAFSEGDKQLTRELAALGQQVGEGSEAALQQLECSVDDNVARVVWVSTQVGWGRTARCLHLRKEAGRLAVSYMMVGRPRASEWGAAVGHLLVGGRRTPLLLPKSVPTRR